MAITTILGRHPITNVFFCARDLAVSQGSFGRDCSFQSQNVFSSQHCRWPVIGVALGSPLMNAAARIRRQLNVSWNRCQKLCTAVKCTRSITLHWIRLQLLRVSTKGVKVTILTRESTVFKHSNVCILFGLKWQNSITQTWRTVYFFSFAGGLYMYLCSLILSLELMNTMKSKRDPLRLIRDQWNTRKFHWFVTELCQHWDRIGWWEIIQKLSQFWLVCQENNF